MDMKIQFLHETFTGKEPELLMKHIRRMGSGEAPFFSTTLSLVFDRLVEKTVAQSVPSGSGLKKSIETQDTAVHTTPPQASTPTSSSPWDSDADFPSPWGIWPVPTSAAFTRKFMRPKNHSRRRR